MAINMHTGISTFKPGDIAQVINEKHQWFKCLVIVEEVKSWGIQGYTTIPLQGDAYIRLNYDEITLVGYADIVTFEAENFAQKKAQDEGS